MENLEELQELIITLRHRFDEVTEISEAIEDCYGDVLSEVTPVVKAIRASVEQVEGIYQHFCVEQGCTDVADFTEENDNEG